MHVSPDDFRRHFGMLSDATLLATRREDLVDSARECYDEELSRRGLKSDAAVAREIAPDDADSEPASSGEEPVVIATFLVAEEASLARGLLQSASIPSHLANEYAGLGGFQLQLMVPEAFVEQAIEVLGAEISEEELAAQAEAAAAPESDFAQDPAEDS